LKKQRSGNSKKLHIAPEPVRGSQKASGTTPLRNLFAIDSRSLALFRVAIGVLLLADLAVRLPDLKAMYTDDGMFSRALICRLATSLWNWSFHFASGSVAYQAFLFGLAAVAGLGLLLGFQTRIATIGSWLMLVSLHHRVPPIISGAEILLRMLLFWAMFLPLGSLWSIDQWIEERRGGSRGPAPFVRSVGSAAILLQMAFMYFFSAISKTNADWLQGRALSGALSHDFFSTSPLSAWLLHFPVLLKCLTWATLALEWAGPLLLFIPIQKGRLRLLVIAALAAMHFGIVLCLHVGFFSYVAIAGLTLFLPPEFWNSVLLRRWWAGFGIGPSGGSHTQSSVRRPPLIRIAGGLCALLVLYMFFLNVASLPGHPLAGVGLEKLRPLNRGLGFSQGWGMFDTIPSQSGWYVARALLKDGSEVDLLRGGAAVTWDKPAPAGRRLPGPYWHKLFREIAYDDEQGFQLLRAPVSEYLCRRWNSEQPAERRIAEFDLMFCSEKKSEVAGVLVAQLKREPLFHLDLTGS